MKRAIVFGGGGFIGSALVKCLLAHGVEACAVVKPGFFEGPEAFRLAETDVPVVECDLREAKDLSARLPWTSADVFYQLAWEGLSGKKMLDYDLQLRNVAWMMDAVDVAAQIGCGKFIGAGTISQDELSTPEGRAYQGDRHRIFRCAAQMCQLIGPSVAAGRDIEFIWPIVSNVYGEGELTPRLITTLVRNLLRGEEMPLSDGTQPYDFVYLSDAAEAFYLIGEKGRSGRRYNIASGQVRPLREYLTVARDVVAPNAPLLLGARASGGIPLSAESFDTAALRADTGFYPKVSFKEGIRYVAEGIKGRI